MTMAKSCWKKVLRMTGRIFSQGNRCSSMAGSRFHFFCWFGLIVVWIFVCLFVCSPLTTVRPKYLELQGPFLWKHEGQLFLKKISPQPQYHADWNILHFKWLVRTKILVSCTGSDWEKMGKSGNGSNIEMSDIGRGRSKDYLKPISSRTKDLRACPPYIVGVPTELSTRVITKILRKKLVRMIIAQIGLK